MGLIKLIIIVLIVILFFAGGRISKVAGELGSESRTLRGGLKGPDGHDGSNDSEVQF